LTYLATRLASALPRNCALGSETKPPAGWMQVALLVVFLQSLGYNGHSEGNRIPLSKGGRKCKPKG
jgi:hypothetical protein